MYILRSLIFVCIVLILSSNLTADVIYEQNVKTSLPVMGETEIRSTIYLKGDKEKTESLTKMSTPIPGMPQSQEIMSTVIARLDRELMWILDVSAKTYTEIDFSEIRELMGKMKQAIPEEEQERPDEHLLKVEVTRLEEEKKIEGYNCEKVTISIDFEDKEEGKKFDMTADLWMAEEKGLLNEIVDFTRRMEELSTGDGGMMEGLSGMIPGGTRIMAEYQNELKDLEGFPIVSEIAIRTEGNEEPLMSLQIRIQNIESAKLEDSDFEIPEGFKKSGSSLDPTLDN